MNTQHQELVIAAFYAMYFVIGSVLTLFARCAAIKRAHRLKATALRERAEAVSENTRLKLQLTNLSAQITNLHKQIELLEFNGRILTATVAARNEHGRC